MHKIIACFSQIYINHKYLQIERWKGSSSVSAVDRTPKRLWIDIDLKVCLTLFNYVSSHVHLHVLTLSSVREHTINLQNLQFRSWGSPMEEKIINFISHTEFHCINAFSLIVWGPSRLQNNIFIKNLKNSHPWLHSFIRSTQASGIPIPIDIGWGIEDTILNKTVSVPMELTTHWVHSFHCLYWAPTTCQSMF